MSKSFFGMALFPAHPLERLVNILGIMVSGQANPIIPLEVNHGQPN